MTMMMIMKMITIFVLIKSAANTFRFVINGANAVSPKVAFHQASKVLHIIK